MTTVPADDHSLLAVHEQTEHQDHDADADDDRRPPDVVDPDVEDLADEQQDTDQQQGDAEADGGRGGRVAGGRRRWLVDDRLRGAGIGHVDDPTPVAKGAVG